VFDTDVESDESHWVSERIGDSHSVSSGGTPSRSAPEYWAGGTIPWVKTAEVDYAVITETSEHITEAGLDHSAAKLLPVGTVLLAMYGQGVTRGKVAILGIDAASNQACAAIQPNSDVVSSRFVYHYLAHQYDELRHLAHGGQQQNLNLDIVRDFPLRYPKSSEAQEEIVELLDALDEKIRFHEARRPALEALFSALLTGLMTGELDASSVDIEQAAVGSSITRSAA
jgi:type I restriction enzyme S subunit